LPAALRSRATFRVIGSATALARQLAALYVRGEGKPVIAVFDGDQASKAKDNVEHAKKMAEKVKEDFEEWFAQRSVYLPGDSWPELWLLQKATRAVGPLADALGTSPDELADSIEYGMQAGKHNEFFEIAKHVGLDSAQCLQVFASVVARHCGAELEHVEQRIQAALDGNG